MDEVLLMWLKCLDLPPFELLPVTLGKGGAFGRFACPAVVVVVAAVVVFLDAALLPCASASELIVAVKNIIVAMATAP